MNAARHIPQDELTRDPKRVLQAVSQGETVVVEEHGEPRATIVDPFDFEILLAVIDYYVTRPRIDSEGLTDSQLDRIDAASRIGAVVAHYLAKTISLSRAAEVLGTSLAELRDRFSRIGIPIRTAPRDAKSTGLDGLAGLAGLWDDGAEFAEEVERVVANRTPPRPLDEFE